MEDPAAITGLTNTGQARVVLYQNNKLVHAPVTGIGLQTALTVSAFGASLIDDADASTALTTLGVSAFAKTLLDDADAATARATLQVGSFKVGSFTRANDGATASVAYTGVGFQPRALFLMGAINGVANYTSWGWSDGTSSHALGNSGNITASTFVVNTSNIITIYQSGVLAQNGSVASFDSDGFTISWVRSGVTGAATITCTYLAIR